MSSFLSTRIPDAFPPLLDATCEIEFEYSVLFTLLFSVHKEFVDCRIAGCSLSNIWSSFTEHPVDIDQLKLIMLLVGTPGPELLKKLSSESVSSKGYTSAVQ